MHRYKQIKSKVVNVGYNVDISLWLVQCKPFNCLTCLIEWNVQGQKPNYFQSCRNCPFNHVPVNWTNPFVAVNVSWPELSWFVELRTWFCVSAAYALLPEIMQPACGSQVWEIMVINMLYVCTSSSILLVPLAGTCRVKTHERAPARTAVGYTVLSAGSVGYRHSQHCSRLSI